MIGTASRRRVFSTLVGIAVGMTLTGMALPFVLGDRLEDGLGVESAAPSPAGPHDALLTAPTGTGIPAAGDDRQPNASAAHERRGDRSTGVAPPSGGGSGPQIPLKIGIMLLDLGGAGRLGFGSFAGVDPEQQRRAFEIYLDEVNEQGGIGGRPVEPVFAVFDVLSPDSRRAACLTVTEDAEVFAVLATPGFQGPPNLCVTVEHRTPLINADFLPTEYLDLSGGLLVSFQQGSTRMMRNFVAELESAGVLRSKVIGVAGQEYPWTKLAVEQGLLPALAAHGYTVTHRSRLSGDLSTAASQVPVEVQQMRARGVDTVLLMTDAVVATQFVQTAASQGWAPSWLASDWHGLAQDWATANMPARFAGATAITSWRTGEWRLGAPPQASDRSCQQRYERHSGESLPRTRDDAENSTYNVTIIACRLVQVFALAARGAGPSLTREGFVDSVQRLGSLELPNQLGASFAPGKVDGADLIRTVRWQASCTCWMPADVPRRSQH